MSKTKTFLEQVSIDIDKGGEIDDDVLREAQRRMDELARTRSMKGVDMQSVVRVVSWTRRHRSI